MASRSRKQSARRKPYDVDNPKNWTAAKLKHELRQRNIVFPATSRHSVLVALYQNRDIPAHSQPDVDVPTIPVEQNGGAEPNNDITLAAVEGLTDAFGKMTENIERLHKRLESVEKELKTHKQTTTSPDNITVSPSSDYISPQPADSVNAQIPVVNVAQPMQITRSPIVIPNIMSIPSAAAGSEAQLQGKQPVYNLHTAYGKLPSIDNNSAGNISIYGYRAETVASVDTLSPHVIEAIIQGKDINLAALLIPYFAGSPIYETGHSTAKESKSDPRLTRTLDINEFTEAFMIYRRVICSAFKRHDELDIYLQEIIRMANRYQGTGFYEYHLQFS